MVLSRFVPLALIPYVVSAQDCIDGQCADVDDLSIEEHQKMTLLQSRTGTFGRRKSQEDSVKTLSTSSTGYNSGSCAPQGARPAVPKTPTEHNGISWPEMCINGDGPHHVMVFGDYGGITCGSVNGSGDPNSWTWTCRQNKKWNEFYARTADNTHDHGDRGRSTFWGIDDRAQNLVAKQMQIKAAEIRPAYVLSGGDNFYFGGLDGWGLKCCHPMDKIHMRTHVQFTAVFEDMYKGPGLDGIPFFSVFGNHDFGGRVFTAAWDQQIAYTWAEGPKVSKRWMLPAFYWHQKVAYPDSNFSVDYFMVDTNRGDAKPWTEDKGHNICGAFNGGHDSCASCGGMPNRYDCLGWFDRMWKDQKKWLEHHLNHSTAEWQIVVSHFPPDQFAPRYWSWLHNIYGIDLYVGSHRHSQEVHIRDNRFHFLNWVVCGGGGGITSEWNPDKSWRGRSQYGFMTLTIDKTNLHIESYNEAGEKREEHDIPPRPAQGELSCKHYGCGKMEEWHGCACTKECWKHGNCCKDVVETCPELMKCEEWGCNSRFDSRKPCQCTSDCQEHGNCCADYAEKCDPTCGNYGCNSEYLWWQACQCGADCWKWGSCCSDYGKTCPELARCEVWGCNTPYDHKKPVQCTEDCMEKGNCAEDYAVKCNATCANYGCNSEFQKWQACQCTDDCWKWGSCCHDYGKVCPSLARCEVWGCNSRFDPKKPCQCTADCKEKGNCCEDHAEKCEPTCEHYGCGSEMKQWQACQCDADCAKRGDCCQDFSKTCPDMARCEVWGCNTHYDGKKPCQCTADCQARGNCCEDYAEKCNPTCDNYGCGSEVKDWQACQCDKDCFTRGDCCKDFSDKCPDLARCEVWGCNTRYDHRKPCQCTKDCQERGNCCEDYAEKCNPSCGNYECGGEMQQWQACQCDKDCPSRGDCCSDFAEKCPQLARCEVWGCNTPYNRNKPCQCTRDCQDRGNCCADYAEKCDATCTNYGCGSAFEGWKACQCDKECFNRGDCCSDFAETCSDMARCELFGCNSPYNPKKPCQCTADCAQHGSCCQDHEEKCKPSCTNYNCTAGESWQACSCAADCWEKNNCCEDFSTECTALASCKELGCYTPYSRKKPCQCSDGCEKYGNCCADFSSSCSRSEQETSDADCKSACDKEAEGGGSYSCQARVEYAIGNQGMSRAKALDFVNDECKGQCSCSKQYFTSLHVKYMAQKNHAPGGALNQEEAIAKKAALLEELKGIEEELDDSAENDDDLTAR
eukprot:TRINITY_DN1730_c0_g2_i1.p1 TRINITY_DN1730_c0_g2~~TRINITY_DN1730_c0_g2_i1.p1  ORF type:complete len:1242 (+),score=311.64 TRINITY_DN1730_c0_g2_i1:123-3848(+)